MDISELHVVFPLSEKEYGRLEKQMEEFDKMLCGRHGLESTL